MVILVTIHSLRRVRSDAMSRDPHPYRRSDGVGSISQCASQDLPLDDHHDGHYGFLAVFRAYSYWRPFGQPVNSADACARILVAGNEHYLRTGEPHGAFIEFTLTDPRSSALCRHAFPHPSSRDLVSAANSPSDHSWYDAFRRPDSRWSS